MLGCVEYQVCGPVGPADGIDGVEIEVAPDGVEVFPNRGQTHIGGLDDL